MKILWFSNTPASGEEYLNTSVIRGGWLKSLDKALKDKVDLHIAFNYPKYVEPFIYNGVHYYPICKKNWKFQIFKKLLFGENLDEEDLQSYLSIIELVKPDLIHIHGSENTYGCIMANCNIPIVLSIQGNRTVINHKYFSGIEKKFLHGKQLIDFNLQSIFFQTSYKSQYLLSNKRKQVEVKTMRNCLNIIGRTDWDRRISRVFSPASIYYHNDEVLRNSFYHTLWSKGRDGKFIINSIIGSGFFKGLETVCEALFELNLLGLNIEWRVAGVTNSDVIASVVKRKLGERFPMKGLVLTGNLNEDILLQNLMESDIYVMPSHIENSPNSLCEAMIIGMPCIATFAGGTGSMLIDGEEGILIQDGDPWVMAGAILELYNNPDLAKKYGERARARALHRHNPEKIVNELLAIYQQIVDQKD